MCISWTTCQTGVTGFPRNLKSGLKPYGKGLQNHIKFLYQYPNKSAYMFITFVHDSKFKHFEELKDILNT